jgi:hypothetical protein
LRMNHVVPTKTNKMAFMPPCLFISSSEGLFNSADNKDLIGLILKEQDQTRCYLIAPLKILIKLL